MRVKAPSGVGARWQGAKGGTWGTSVILSAIKINLKKLKNKNGALH